MAALLPGTFLEVNITDVDDEANGTVHLNGMLLKIVGAAPGDQVRIRVDHVSRHRATAWAGLVRVIQRGSSYSEPHCSASIQQGGQCGGCPALHLSPETALEMKRRAAADELESRGITTSVTIEASPLQSAYRNRANFIAARDRDGKPFLGSYRPRSHEVAHMDGCPVLREPMAQTASRIELLLHAQGIPVHPEIGGLRCVTLRASQQRRVLVDLVAGEQDPSWLSRLSTEMMSLPDVEGVSFSFNTTEGNALRTSGSATLCGAATIDEPMGGVSFPMAASTFSQLNSAVAGAMYLAAADAVSGATVLWDLYCGSGGLGLNALARHPHLRLFGAESIAASIALAKLAARNTGGAAHFETADLSVGVPAWPDPDIILVNPPRRGLDAAVRDAICQSRSAEKLVYMSCNPRTFAVDAVALRNAGWQLLSVRAWDMLPGTAHVELLGYFQKDASSAPLL